MEKIKKDMWPFVMVLGVIFIGVLVVGGLCTFLYFAIKTSTKSVSEERELEGKFKIEIKKAESCEELKEMIKTSGEEKKLSYGLEGVPKEGEGIGSIDFSQTNVQVEGIDEADVVKNDGEYIYYVNNGVVKIAKAYPAEELAVVSTIKSDNAYFSGIYIYEDKLIGIGGRKEKTPIYEEVEKINPYYGSFVEIWNIADRKNPKMEKGWFFEGFILSSRLKNDDLYIIIEDDKYVYGESTSLEVIPRYKEYEGEEKDIVKCTDVWVPEEPWSTNYIEVVGIRLGDNTYDLSSEVVFGMGWIVYMSNDHIFVAGEYYPETKPVFRPIYWIIPPHESGEKTIITRFDYEDGYVRYKGYGEVPGHLLNQFSMDEYKGYLRVATTKKRWDGDRSTSGVYILDDDLKITGEIVGLARGERIYAARFIKDIAYLVTFRQIDPLFVLDLSDPENPELLGKLKIPGFSNYLHPWKDHYLIGFGMEIGGYGTEEGFKIGLFDVSDQIEPREIDKIVVGGTGSTSQILFDHHTLLSNEEDGWLAIPIEEIGKKRSPIEYGPSEPVPPPRITEYQGLYIFDIDTDSGISLRGKITHHKESDMTYECKYGVETNCNYWQRDIQRGVYIGEYIYAISNESVSAHVLKDLSLVKKVDWR